MQWQIQGAFPPPPPPHNGTIFFRFHIRFCQNVSTSDIAPPPPPHQWCWTLPTGNPGSATEMPQLITNNTFFSCRNQTWYHPVTFIMYVNEVVKRADPKARSLWVIFDEDIAQECGTSIIGLFPNDEN